MDAILTRGKFGGQERRMCVYGSAGRIGVVSSEATVMTEGEDEKRAVSTWRIASVMWPNASLRNQGKHEVETVNTNMSHYCGWSAAGGL